MNILLSIDRYIRLGLRSTIIALMVTMTVLVFMQVVFRYVWDSPLAWSEEISRFLFVWLTFISAANLVRVGQHVAVKTFVEMLPPVPRLFSEVVGHLIVISCCIMFFVGGLGITTKEWIQRSPALQIEMGWIYLVIPISAALMTVWAVVGLVSTVCERKTRGEL